MIKRFFALVCAIIMVASLCVITPLKANAEGMTTDEYGELFDLYCSSDGAYAEKYLSRLCDLFAKDPLSLLLALSQESESVQRTVSGGIASHYYGNRDAFLEKVSSLFGLGGDDVDGILTMMVDQISWLDETITVGDAPDINTEDYAFDVAVIRNFININLLYRNFDEGFYHTVANAYLENPHLFIKMISDFSLEDIQYLGEAISYDLMKTDRASMVADNTNWENENHKAIATLILNEIHNADNQTLDTTVNIPMQTGIVSPYVVELPVGVSTLQFTTGSLIVGQIERLNATITLSGTTNPLTNYYIEVYCEDETSSVLLASKSVEISETTTVQIPVSFTNTGDYTINVSLYDVAGGTLLGSSNLDIIVYGYWRISVILPEDRSYKGMLYLYNADGTLQMSTECLGKSAKNLDMSQINGDTPTGEYTGVLAHHYDDTIVYGPYKVIKMTGVSGKIAEYSHRSGIWIHGGREGYASPSATYYPLYPTYGCVRISNSAQYMLQECITAMIADDYHYQTGNISITER